MSPKLKGKFRSHLTRHIAIILVVIAIIGVGIPQAISLYYQNKAGGLLDAYLQRAAEEYQDHFACLIPMLAELPVDEGDETTQAVDLLLRAGRITPNHAHIDYLLGQAYCLKQDYEGAVTTFDAYTEQRPDAPLGWMEKAFAYFSTAQALDEEQGEAYGELMEECKSALNEAGVGESLLIQHAEIAYENLDYQTAWVWYQIAAFSKDLTGNHAFKKSILDIVYLGQNENDGLKSDPIALDDETIILPQSYFYLTDGTPIPTGEINGQQTGKLYRNREASGVLITVLETGCYQLSIDILDRPPKGTLLELSIDLTPYSFIELPNGDDTWVKFDFHVQLKVGDHLLGLRLVNDGKIDGVDRNGYVGSLEISECYLSN